MRALFAVVLLIGASVSISSAQSVPQQILYPELSGEALMTQIRAAYKPASVYSYDTARDSMFARVYNVSGVVTCVYTGDTMNIPYGYPTPRTLANANVPMFNTEHVFPQSMGAEFGNANSDMHHLMPVRGDANSSRSNTLFGYVSTANVTKWWGENGSQTTTPSGDLSVWSRAYSDIAFEPRDASKGNIARAAFYFYTMYTTETTTSDDPLFFAKMKDALRAFHNADPVDALEYSRTQHIARMQGNKPNPFIIDTTLVRRIYFSDGTYTPPPPDPETPTSVTIAFDDASAKSVSGYALGTLTSGGLTWSLSEALIGSDVSDMKNGTRSVRVRHSQTVNTILELVTNRDDGIGTVSFAYARSNFSGDRTGISPTIVLDVATGDRWVQVGESISLAGVDALTTASFSVQEPGPSRIRIRSISGDSGKRFNIDDIVITPYADETEDLAVPIANTPGWRLLSSPIATTYAAFLAPVWTQGATGSDAPAGGANVFRYSPAAGFVPVTALSDPLAPGEGFAYYHFNDDNYDGTPNTAASLLDVSGAKPAGVVTLSVASADTARYVLLGNPFSVAMDVDDVVRTGGAMDVVQVWDPAEARYKARSAGVGDFDGRLAPFQGFWTRVGAQQSGSFRFDRAAITSGSVFYGKERPAPVLEFTICESHRDDVTNCESRRSDRTYISFHPEGEIGADAYDAPKLPSLEADHPLVSTLVGGTPHHIQFLPWMLTEPVEIPLRITGADPSRIRLEMNAEALPAHLTAELVGDVVVIMPSTTSTENRQPKTDNGFELAQNYPNPFNPSTVIRFAIAETQNLASLRTRLRVVDILGREVAVLIDRTMPAGSHSVTFDASNLPSGVYLYTLEVEGMTTTKRMVLVK